MWTSVMDTTFPLSQLRVWSCANVLTLKLAIKIKALGGKYEHIKNIVQENSIAWKDEHLELVEIPELFGISAEKIGEYIVTCQARQKM